MRPYTIYKVACSSRIPEYRHDVLALFRSLHVCIRSLALVLHLSYPIMHFLSDFVR